MPILVSVVQQLTPSNLTRKGKGQHWLCSHKKSHFSAPLWSFRLQGCLNSRTGWEEGERGEEEVGWELCAGSALRGKESRDQRAEKLLLHRGHKGHKPAKGGGEGCFSMSVRKKKKKKKSSRIRVERLQS